MSLNLYDYAVSYLKEQTGNMVDDAVLADYFEVSKAKSLDEAFARGVASVIDANKPNMANPIAYFKPERKTAIDKILCDLKLDAVVKKYGNNVEKLWHDLCSQCVNSTQIIGGAWYKFAKNIITLAAYLSKFSDIDELYDEFEKAVTPEEKIKLVNAVSAQV